MSMPIEAFMPCLGTVDVCVKSKEENVPVGCCPSGIDSSKIITYLADYVSNFTINYNGPLFTLFSNTDQWKVSVHLECLGSASDVNIQGDDLVFHDPTVGPQTLTGQVVFNNDITKTLPLVPGEIYKPVYKVELIVNGTLIVCAFTEGDIFHAGEQ